MFKPETKEKGTCGNRPSTRLQLRNPPKRGGKVDEGEEDTALEGADEQTQMEAPNYLEIGTADREEPADVELHTAFTFDSLLSRALVLAVLAVVSFDATHLGNVLVAVLAVVGEHVMRILERDQLRHHVGIVDGAEDADPREPKRGTPDSTTPSCPAPGETG